MAKPRNDACQHRDHLGLRERHAGVVHGAFETIENRIELLAGRLLGANRGERVEADLGRDLPGRNEFLVGLLPAGIERRQQHRIGAAGDFLLDRAARGVGILIERGAISEMRQRSFRNIEEGPQVELRVHFGE